MKQAILRILRRLTAVGAALFGCPCESASSARAETSPTRVVFSRSGSNALRHATWDGSSWSASAAGTTLSGSPHWVSVAGCPVRDEVAVASVDGDKRIQAQLIQGGAFGSATTLASDSGYSVTRPVAVAYEQSTGDALVAYSTGSGKSVAYRTSSGGSWSSAGTAFSSAGTVAWVSLVSRPGSDQVVLASLDGSKELNASVWSGTGWASSTRLTASATSDTSECFATAYESTSGAAMVIFSQGGATAARYRLCASGIWSSASTLPAVSGAPLYIRAAGNPASDVIACAILDSNKRVTLFIWDGSSWSSGVVATTDNGNTDRRGFDVAFEPDGSHAVAMYSDNASRPSYRVWDGSSWSSEYAGPASGSPVQVLSLTRGGSSNEIFSLWNDSAGDLKAGRWDGVSSGFGSAAALETSLGGTEKSEPFSLAANAVEQELRVIRWREVPNPDPEG